MLPDYINCNEKDRIVVCDYYMTADCKETCAYALDIRGLGIGAMVINPKKLLEEMADENI